MTVLGNPYQFSNPVYREGEFFDRQVALTRLSQALSGRRSVQLSGQDRIGKSSLLRHIHKHLTELIDDDRAIAIYYNLSRRPHLRNSNDFFARIWQLMSKALVDRGQQEAMLSPNLDLSDPYGFDDFLNRWVEEKGFHFIFLLDEFSTIARNKNFDLDFFDNLRSTIPTLTYILGTPRSLSEFAHEQVISSPLWNKLQLIQVTLFEKREFIQELIHQPIERIGLSWPEKAEDFIYERGGQHPCYIQMAAAALYDTQDQWRMNYKEAEKVFRDTAIDHFRYLWKSAMHDYYRPEREQLLQKALLDLAHGHNIDDDLAEDLETRSLVWRNQSTGQWEPFSASFTNWLRRWSTSKRVQMESEFLKLPMSNVIPLKGQLLEEKYRVQKIIGTSSHSYVVRAYDESLQRKVVIKIPRLEQEPDDTNQRIRETLLREARIMGSLKHSNIGQVYHAITNPLGVVVEWIEGSSLQKILDEGIRLSETDIIRIGIDLAKALDYVHKKGIIHRDIKPSNIILTATGQPILIDFDIARISPHDTISRLNDGSFGYLGTKEYSAPEQFLNPEGVGPYTDLFALGLVLYQLLTGRLPYEYGNLPSLYIDGFPKPEPHNNIPESLYQILCDLLNEKPEQRPHTTKLVEALLKLA